MSNRPQRPYPKPTVDRPSLDALGEMVMDCECETTDGCIVEPDGWCEHGHVSWLMYLGWI